MSTEKRKTLYHRHRRAGPRQPEHHDRRSARPGAAAGRLVAREARAFRPRGDPRAPHARQGLGRVRHLHGHARHHPLHQGQDLLRGRQEDADVRPVLHRRRRARRGRRRARHPRLRGEVLHRGGQLGPGRQQHAGVLLPRPAEVPRPQPRGEARPAHQPAQRREQLGLLDAAARGAAPGHDRDVRPRHPDELPPHARLRLPHLQLHQRRERALLGQVPLPHPAGHQEPDRRRGRGARRQGPREPPARPVRTRSSAATSRGGRSSSRSCPRPQAKTYRTTRST